MLRGVERPKLIQYDRNQASGKEWRKDKEKEKKKAARGVVGVGA